MRKSPFLRCFVVTVGCLAGIVQALANTPREETVARVAPSVAADLAAGRTRLPVIVHLDAPAAAHRPLQRQDARGDTLRVATIGPIVREQLAAFSGFLDEPDFRVVRALTLQPAFAAVVSPHGLSFLLSSPAVRFIEKDVSWRVHTEQGLDLINATEVHKLGLAGDGTAIAIVDTGIDPTQPALGGREFPNAKIVHGLDTGDGDGDPTDCGTHGTAVAAIAAGSSYQWNPQLRFAGGVAPEAKLLAYKASRDAECDVLTLSAVISAMEDAVLHRTGDDYALAAINISGGAGLFASACDDQFTAYARAVADATQAGIPVVASSGNQGELAAIAAPACMSQVIGVGSVWDVDTDWGDVGFCLDPECSNVCTDSLMSAGTVTCYTNIGPTLDLLAPSEFLTTVRAGGQTVEFGGTSGAAAYVSGALAVLRSALPSEDPATARLRLQMTGRPMLDRRSGLVRPLVDLARAVQGVPGFAGAAPAEPVAAAGDQPITSTVWIGDSGPIGSARVLLHLAHQHPEDLFVKLSSPEGMAIRLHDRGSGALHAGGGTAPAAGLWGSYPDELVPVDSLGVFGGQEMSGRWTLEVGDVGVPDSGTGVLADWALEITPLSDPLSDPAPVLFVPVVAHRSGIDGAEWTSDLRIFNPSAADVADVTLRFFESSGDGVVTHRQSDLVIHPRTLVGMSDLVGRYFGVTQARGSLKIASSSPLFATSHTWTTGKMPGRYGQYVGTETEETVVELDRSPVYLVHLADDHDSRTNLGFSEISGNPLVVSLTVFDGDSGEQIGAAQSFSMAPFSNAQIRLSTRVARGNVYAVVHAVEGAGKVFAYASRIDARTNDAVFLPGRRPGSTVDLMVPVVARTVGRGGTEWRSDVRIANLESFPVSVELQLRQRLGEPGRVTTVVREIGSGHVLASDDVVQSLFGLDHTVGSLRIVARSGTGRLLASSRTYNVGPRGTYGQYIPAVHAGSRHSATLLLHADDGASRTNLGLCEVGGGQLTVRCRLFDRIGRPLAEPIVVELAPYRLAQLNNVFAYVGLPSGSVSSVEFDGVTGDGAFVGYASVVDGTTGDAVFVPAHPTTDSNETAARITRGPGQTPP